MAQSQCVANIENNPLNYERDWQLDDSSQSSFKPCPQGSGSMTPLPFHDSAHTMYEANSQFRSVHSSMDGSGLDLNQIPNSAQILPLVGASTNTIASASNDNGNATNKTDYGLFKVHSSGPHRSSRHHYPTSSVFLENSDILDDKDYPKLFRHSTIMMAPDEINCPNETKIRRYSDTKLLHTAKDDDDDDNETDIYTRGNYNQPMPIFNVATVLGASIPTTSNETHSENYQITDIIFDDGQMTGGTYDPLELNIQEMLELDMATNRRYSMNNIGDGFDDKCNIHYSDVGNSTNNTAHVNNSENRNIFKSMPNLSASSENLLQK